MPITVEGHVIGAVGVSGASSAPEDQELAEIGQAAGQRAAAGASTGEAVYFSESSLTTAFEHGGLLVAWRIRDAP